MISMDTKLSNFWCWCLRFYDIVGNIQFRRRWLEDISSRIWFSWFIILTFSGWAYFVIIWVTGLAAFRQIKNSSWTYLSVWFWVISHFAYGATFIIGWSGEWLDWLPVWYIVERIRVLTVTEADIHDKRS